MDSPERFMFVKLTALSLCRDVLCTAIAAVFVGAISRSWLLKGHHLNPTDWPLLGMLPALLLNLNHFYDWVTNLLINNGGSFSFHGPWFSGMRYFLTSDPRNVEHVLLSHFHNYPKGKDMSDIFQDLLGQGIFNADHQLWKMQRKVASLQLNSRACRQFTDAAVFNMVENKLLPVLQSFCEEEVQVDMQDLMLRLTFDTVCLVSFGVDVGCLSVDLPEVPFAMAFESALESTTLRFFLPSSWWKLLKWLGLSKERTMPQALRVVNEFSDKVISSKKNQFKHNAEAGHDHTESKLDLLSCFLRMNDDLARDDKFLKDVAVNFLLAGRDTSALALSWFFWLLANHPEVEERVVQEVQQVMAMAKQEGKTSLTRTELNRMPYLHAALTETLRLYPSVPIDIKQAVRDDVLPDGHHVKEGDKFIYSIYTMGRMESIWGKDCMSFRPERWLRSDGQFEDSYTPSFGYLAFNAGPRICLGKDLAYLLMKTVASTVLYHFKMRLLPGQNVVPKLSITLYLQNGLLVELEPRYIEDAACNTPSREVNNGDCR